MADKDPIITRDFVRGVFEIRQEPDGRWQESLDSDGYGCCRIGDTLELAVTQLCSLLNTVFPLQLTPRNETFLRLGDFPVSIVELDPLRLRIHQPIRKLWLSALGQNISKALHSFSFFPQLLPNVAFSRALQRVGCKAVLCSS